MLYKFANKIAARTIGAAMVIFCMFVATPVLAAQISFSSPTTQISVNQEFEVSIYLDTSGENVNAISATVSYPGSVLQVKEIRDADSVIPLWIEQPHAVSGEVAFAGIIPGGYSGKNGLVMTLVFQALSAGSGNIEAATVRALRNDGQGSQVPISAQPLALVIVSSNAQTSNTPLTRDTNPPEDFTPQIAQDPSLFNDQWFVSFVASDKETGIARYQVKEVSSPLLAAFASWKDAQSPHLLSDQSLSSYVYVRATDQAGNSRTERIDPQHPLPWHENLGLLAIFLIGVVILGYWLWRRKV